MKSAIATTGIPNSPAMTTTGVAVSASALHRRAATARRAVTAIAVTIAITANGRKEGSRPGAGVPTVRSTRPGARGPAPRLR